MKEIYQRVVELLATVTELRFIDKDKGQLEYYKERPAVAFPCALIKLDIPRIENLGKTTQRRTAVITIRVAFDYVGQTSASLTEQARNQSLQYFDIIQSIEQAIEAQTGIQNILIHQTSAGEENRPDGLLILNMKFQTQYLKS